MSIASFTFLFATSRSFPGFAANRRRERRGRSAYYIALFCLFVVLKTSIFIKLFKTERGTKKAEKERERERERERIRIRRCVRLPTERFRRDRSIDRQRQLHAGLVVVPRDTTRRRRKKERKDNFFVVVLRQSRRRKKTTSRRESCEGVRHENDAMHAPKSSPSLILLRRGAD